MTRLTRLRAHPARTDRGSMTDETDLGPSNEVEVPAETVTSVNEVCLSHSHCG